MHPILLLIKNKIHSYRYSEAWLVSQKVNGGGRQPAHQQTYTLVLFGEAGV